MRGFSLQLFVALFVATLSAALACGCGGNVLTVGMVDMNDGGPQADTSLIYGDSGVPVYPDSSLDDTGYPPDTLADSTVDDAEDAADAPADTGPTDATTDGGDADAGDAPAEAAPPDAGTDGSDADAGDTTTADTGPGVDSTSSGEGGADDSGLADSGTGQDATPSFSVTVTVSGLAPGDTLKLEDNGGDTVFVTMNGPVTFPTLLDSGSAYNVTVSSPVAPVAQGCTITKGSGTVVGGNITDPLVSCMTSTFPVGGTVLGLTTSQSVTLQDNSAASSVLVTSNGTFTFPGTLASGATYNVTVQLAAGATCSVSAGTGTVGNGPVTGIVVNCAANTFTVAGTVTGLGAGDTVVLENNGGNSDPVSVNGTFAFTTPLTAGSTYTVTVASNPASPVPQICTVTKGAGTITANVSNVLVTCATSGLTVGGTLAGLAAGDSVVLQDNAGDNLPLTANGTFQFATPVAFGQPYAVTVLTNPGSPVLQACSVTAGNGTIASTNVTNVTVTCANVYTIGGTISGLGAGDSVVLQDNGADNLALGTNGPFTFATTLMHAQTYLVTVHSQPSSPTVQSCSVSNPNGTVSSSNVTSVVVSCGYSIAGTIVLEGASLSSTTMYNVGVVNNASLSSAECSVVGALTCTIPAVPAGSYAASASVSGTMLSCCGGTSEATLMVPPVSPNPEAAVTLYCGTVTPTISYGSCGACLLTLTAPGAMIGLTSLASAPAPSVAEGTSVSCASGTACGSCMLSTSRVCGGDVTIDVTCNPNTP